MRVFLTILTCSLLVCSFSRGTSSTEDLGRGFGEKYEWHSLEDGLQLSKETGKPLMLIIHKSWCGACKAFKPKFAESTDILELSENFVMVNTLDSEEPQDKKYSPDGGYIPRILFINTAGEVQEDIYNKSGNPSYKFFYFEDQGVVKAMQNALETMPSPSGKEDGEL